MSKNRILRGPPFKNSEMGSFIDCHELCFITLKLTFDPKELPVILGLKVVLILKLPISEFLKGGPLKMRFLLKITASYTGLKKSFLF